MMCDKGLPCYNCIVKAMCDNPCDEMISFLKNNLRGKSLNDGTYYHVAVLFLRGKIILYPYETPQGVKYFWEMYWSGRSYGL